MGSRFVRQREDSLKLCQIIFQRIQTIITYVDNLIAATTAHQEMINSLNKLGISPKYNKAETIKTKQAIATLSSNIKPAFPIAVSNLQWKFEQTKDTTCREMRDFVDKKRMSLIPKVNNVIKLYGHKSTIDQPSGLSYIFTARNEHMTSEKLWDISRFVRQRKDSLK